MAEGKRSGAILVVDDDARLRESVMLLLGDAGYRALGAANGREALEIAERESPSLILLDLMMPVMDGWQFLSERAEHRGARQAAVVLLSGLAFIRDAPGVAGFLTKPIRTESLLDYAQRFGSRSAQQDRAS
jgi:CheY-like chemotaxis protein